MLNLDQYAVDLYRNSRRAYERGDLVAAHEFYRRNRAENGVELFWETELPEIWRCVHPLGSVMGRATYADYFCFYHGCSVGSTVDGDRPTFTGPCVMFPGSRVLGPVTVGANVWISAGTMIQGRQGYPIVIPSNVVVFQRGSGFDWSHTKRSVMGHFFP